MASKSYLYEPLGAHPKRPWRDFILSRTRIVAILLIVALSLITIFLFSESPWSPSAVVPKTFHPASSSSPITSVPSISLANSTSKPNPPYPAYPPTAAHVGSTTYHPFLAPTAAQALADPRIQPIRAQAALSDACLDRWVSSGQWGEPCMRAMVNESRIDLVYVWVNGSDVLHQQARKALLEKTHYRTKEARFREHDELRFSLRAARAATQTWPNSTWHIITADVPDPSPGPLRGDEPATVVVDLDTALARARSVETSDTSEGESGGRRLGLVPQWLDIECAYHGESGGDESERQPPIRLQHDTQLFRLTTEPGVEAKSKDAEEWLKTILPSFNSHAVESALPQLDSALVSDEIVALNDDQFILLPLPPSAFHTTLYGPVFRVDPNLLVGGSSDGGADGNGEWRSLGWSAHLLNQRFGTRKRPYMQHNARAMSLPLMHEAALAFGSYFAKTPLSQFRGSHKVAGEFEVNTIFQTTHFVLERHREALLYSWVVLKWDGDRDGMWRDLGGKDGADVVEFGKRAERTTGDDVELNLLMAGVAPPKAIDDQVQGDTTYTWTSMDGFSAKFNALITLTTVQRSSCFGSSSESSWDLFRRLLTVDIDCGDQIISALIHKHKSGLGAFLPPPASSPPSAQPDPLTLPLILPILPPPLPSNPRTFAVRLLQRYAHVFGDSPTRFLPLQSARMAENSLRETDAQRATALLCLNDDLGSSPLAVSAADKVLHEWFKKRWPEKLRCEL
ncbi:hypothetical protein MKEN_00445100 [Mycena kentingensis (nom. inval.)]|nr:hypothetical protein MKEN_00445100 [Mycena kentingensis (nom. inval.)]